MLILITVVLFGILVALFASQNTGYSSVVIATYTLKDIPMYLIVLVSLLLGLLLSSLINIINSISSSLTIRGKNVKIKQSKETELDLTKRIHELEIENERLKTKHNDVSIDDRSL